MNLKQEIKSFSLVMAMVISLLSISLYLVTYIIKNYVDIDSLFSGNVLNKEIYVIANDKDFKYLQNHLKYRIHRVKDIQKLSLNTILIVLKKTDKELLFHYLNRGGHLITNQNFLDKNIKSIINLDKYRLLSTPLSFLKIDKNINLYDDIKIYNGDSLADMTLDYHSYPVIFNGVYQKGEWIFFSFPFYIIKQDNNVLTQMIDFYTKGYKIVKYPYIDTKKALFISEYSYYKFDKNFIDLIDELGLKATIFANPKLNLTSNKNIELASASLNNILNLKGFSNENLKPTIKKLKDNGYLYTIKKDTKVTDNFVILSNKGFNDLVDNVDEFIKKQ